MPRNCTTTKLFKTRTSCLPATASGAFTPVLVCLLLSPVPAHADSELLLSIASLELDRYITRTPSQANSQLPARTRRSGRQPTVRDFIYRDLNPHRDFNYLWLRNLAGKKQTLAQRRLFGGALRAGVRLFGGKRIAAEIYYVTYDPESPHWGELKQWLGMSSDQVRFRLRYHF